MTGTPDILPVDRFQDDPTLLRALAATFALHGFTAKAHALMDIAQTLAPTDPATRDLRRILAQAAPQSEPGAAPSASTHTQIKGSTHGTN